MKADVYQWNKYIRRQIVVGIIPWIAVLIYFLLWDKTEPFSVGMVIWAIVLNVVLCGVLHVARRLYLGMLIIQDLDFQTVYELDKRSPKPKNEKYNWMLLLNVYFYGGRVEEMQEIYEKLVSLPLKPNEAYVVHHAKIMTDFLWGDTTNVEAAIVQQEQLVTQKGVKIGSSVAYYKFMQLYLQGQYAEAVESVSALLNDELIKIDNLKKVMVYTLMRMAYEKMGDTEQMQACKMNILQSDLHLRTIFARQVCGN